MRTYIVLASVLVLAPGCFINRSIVNEPITKESVAQLVPGQTTADQALEILGAPTEVVQLGKRSAWRYEHVQSKQAVMSLIVFTAANIDAHADRLWLFFDENDVLKHAGATLSAGKAEWAMPWSSSNK